MSDLLKSWLGNDIGIHIQNAEKDFANGCLFGQILHQYGMQPDFEKFDNKRTPDAMVNNYTRLQPSLVKLGLQFDTRTANSLMREEPGVALRLLYTLKQNLGQINKDVQKFQHSGRLGKELGATVPVTRALLDAQQHNTHKEKTASNALRFFEENMRNKVDNNNSLMEGMKLRRYMEEMYRQERRADTLTAQEHSEMEATRATFRASQLTKMEQSKNEKGKKLQHDDAVHATLLKHKEELEREELRVELALSEKARRKKLEELSHASLDVNHGIDAFEINMKRLVKGDTGEEISAMHPGRRSGAVEGSPMEHMNKMKSMSVPASKLLEASASYTSSVASQRAEDVATKREREARRRKVVVEQQQAAELAASKAAEELLVATLAHQSQEELKLAERLWQLRQEKEVMRENRIMREQQYAERREKDWEATLKRESELHKSMKEQYEAQAKVEMEAWKVAEAARAAAKAAKHRTACRDIAWQLVMLAERAAEHRASTGANVPVLEYRRWLAMFTSGDPALGDPVVPHDAAAAAEADEKQRQLARATVEDYLDCAGAWVRTEAQGGPIGSNAHVGEAVSALVVSTTPKVLPSDLPNLPYPLRLAVVGAPFSGKTSIAQDLAKRFKLQLLNVETLVSEAIKASEEYVPPPPAPLPAPTEGLQEVVPEKQQVPEEVPVPPLVVMGRHARESLAQGLDLPDRVAVELLVRAMKAVGDVPPPPPPDPKAKGKGGKHAAAAEAELPPQGFVVDGFPRTEAQAALLEKALTGLNLEQEAGVVAEASRLAPPPLGALPQVTRPLRSGLDAVLVVGLADEAAALKRALGRRLDPATGRVYHVEFDPPPDNDPGLIARLVEVTDTANDAVQIQRRLNSYSSQAVHLDDWLKRFVKLRRPIDGTAAFADVMVSAADAAQGILRAKQAVSSALASVAAAGKAKESAERAAEFAELARGHAEAAARELLSAKKAELAAAALLADAKTKVPDAAATEVLKAQSAAKCAEQLKVAKAAATDAGTYAERAQEAAAAAAEAKSRAESSLGDAEVNASAEEAAKVHAEQAEAARQGAAEAAAKAETARAAAEVAAAEAERIFGAETVAPDATVQLSPAADTAATQQAAAVVPGAEEATMQVPADPVPIPDLLSEALLSEWRSIESTYLEGLTLTFATMAEQHATLVQHFDRVRSSFKQLLLRPDSRASMVSQFQHQFNSIDVDARKLKETKAELVLRAEELRDGLWAVCDRKLDGAEAERTKLAADSFVQDQSVLLGQYFTRVLQIEMDRLFTTKNFLQGYTNARYGILPPTDGSALETVELGPDLMSGVMPPDLKDKLDEKSKTQIQFPAWVTALQAKSPSLMLAFKVAIATMANLKTALETQDDVGSSKVSRGKDGGKVTAAVMKGKDKKSSTPPGIQETLIDAKIKTAIAAEMVEAGGRELAMLEKRLEMLAEQAVASMEFVSESSRLTVEDVGKWMKARYHAECGAVLALDRVIKAAAMAGVPLKNDLRLEDDSLIVDEGLKLVPPAPAMPIPAAKERTPLSGMLSTANLSEIAKSFGKVAPDGWMRLSEVAQMMCQFSVFGHLPSGWQGTSLSQMMAALRVFDPTHTTYIDWREVVCSLISTTFPAIMRATCADMADQITMLKEADDNHDGLLTMAQWTKVELWFQYKAFLIGSEDDLEAAHAIPLADRQKQAYDRASALKGVLWEMFGGSLPSGPDGSSLINFRSALLYLCPDRDMFMGIKKAFSVASHNISPNARAQAEQIMMVAYPLSSEMGKDIGRSPFDLEAVKGVVSTIYESRKAGALAPAAPSRVSGGKAPPLGKAAAAAAAAAAAQAAPAATEIPTITAEQLMYSAGGERLVVQLMHRYQWKDVYVATKMT